MKTIIEKVLECLMAFLPFLSGRGKKRAERMKKVKEFSELVREQYEFLVAQLEKVLQDYFGLSERIKEMHTEMFSLRTELAEGLAHRCMRRECGDRQPTVAAE